MHVIDDHPQTVVALHKRRHPFTMGLVWITMVAGFPTLIIGFQWRLDGLSLAQVITCTVIGCLLLLLYALPASYLGAKTGQTYALLSRKVFGQLGTKLVIANLVWIFVTFYALGALFLSEGLVSLLKLPASVAWLATALALIMSVNNFFGFKGIANFARYFAAPILIIWGLISFVKAMPTIPSSLAQHSSSSFWAALTSISGFVIGYGTWGNEADYWRFSKPCLKSIAIPTILALAVGQICFPITGWLISKITSVSDINNATAVMNQYSFSGMSIFAAIVLAASYFAANDSGLYGSNISIMSLVKIPHRLSVSFLALAGAIIAYMLSQLGAVKALEIIASINSVVLPIPTIIIMMEWFIFKQAFHDRLKLEEIQDLKTLPLIRPSAVIALLVGIVVGIVTSGTIPGTQAFGIYSVQAWLATAVVYAILRIIEHNKQTSSFSHISNQLFEQAEENKEVLARTE